MTICVTGAAGFIGYHVVRQLLARGDDVIGLDDLNDYYDPALKQARLNALTQANLAGKFHFEKCDIANAPALNAIFKTYKPKRVINLAAQAGVRFSLESPQSYVQSNVVGFTNILEACRHFDVEHFSYASTSSVYGSHSKMPYSEHASVDHPLQFYAATKKANELMAHSYSHLFNVPTTGLRFFTVYGPWGRPDMALFKFTKNIIEGKPIEVYNHGKHSRDFTYIDDIVDGVIRVNDTPATPNPSWDAAAPDPATSDAPYRVYNIGNSTPVSLLDFIRAIETATARTAETIFLPQQPGDALSTFADISALSRDMGYEPKTSLQSGVNKFVAWYRDYYDV